MAMRPQIDHWLQPREPASQARIARAMVASPSAHACCKEMSVREDAASLFQLQQLIGSVPSSRQPSVLMVEAHQGVLVNRFDLALI